MIKGEEVVKITKEQYDFLEDVYSKCGTGPLGVCFKCHKCSPMDCKDRFIYTGTNDISLVNCDVLKHSFEAFAKINDDNLYSAFAIVCDIHNANDQFNMAHRRALYHKHELRTLQHRLRIIPEEDFKFE